MNGYDFVLCLPGSDVGLRAAAFHRGEGCILIDPVHIGSQWNIFRPTLVSLASSLHIRHVSDVCTGILPRPLYPPGSENKQPYHPEVESNAQAPALPSRSHK